MTDTTNSVTDALSYLAASKSAILSGEPWTPTMQEMYLAAADSLDTLRAQLAEAQRRIKELETPTMFWDFDNPEHGAFDSPYHLICDGDFDEGAEVSFMTARGLPAVSVRVTRDNDGNYNYEYIDAAKGD